MPSATDPLDMLGGTKDELGKDLAQLRAAVSDYAEVRDLAQHPGWQTFICALEARSQFWRKNCEDLLTAIVFSRDPDQERAFADARIHHLATDEAIFIYITMREEARKAKEALDKMSDTVRDSE